MDDEPHSIAKVKGHAAKMVRQRDNWKRRAVELEAKLVQANCRLDWLVRNHGYGTRETVDRVMNGFNKQLLCLK